MTPTEQGRADAQVDAAQFILAIGSLGFPSEQVALDWAGSFGLEASYFMHRPHQGSEYFAKQSARLAAHYAFIVAPELRVPDWVSSIGDREEGLKEDGYRWNE